MEPGPAHTPPERSDAVSPEVANGSWRPVVIATGLSLALHLGALVLGRVWFSEWRWAHHPVHAAVEIAGSIIALQAAFMLLTQRRLGYGTSFNTVIAGALVGMGLLDGMHAVVHAGHHFVLLHSLATFVGGVLFSCVWLGGAFERRVARFWIPVAAVSALGLGLLMSLVPSMSPTMLRGGSFTATAIFLNLAGGGLLLLSAAKLMLVWRQTRVLDDALFAVHCLLFGLAATMFYESQLWDFAWWSWHGLRLLAYLVALAFLWRAQRAIEARVREREIDDRLAPVLERLEYTLQAANIGVWELELSDWRLSWNDQMYAFHQLPPGTAMDFQTWLACLRPVDRAPLREALVRSVQRGSRFEFEMNVPQADGNVRVLQCRARFSTDDDGRSTRAYGVAWDATEEADARSEIVKLVDTLAVQNRALDSIAGISESNPSGTILYVNQRFTEMTGYSEQELIGASHRLLRSGEHDTAFYSEMWKCITAGEVWHGELRNRRKDGSFYWVDTWIFPTRNADGTIERYLSFRLDITERRKLQLEMVAARRAAEAALDAKSAFLANMSHEIRTPMNGLLGAADLLLRSESLAEKDEYGHIILDSGRSLMVIINDILDLSKIESGRLAIEHVPLDFRRVVDEAVTLFDDEASAKGLTLIENYALDAPSVFAGDPTRIRQILLNLLSNAVKFTSQGVIAVNVTFEGADKDQRVQITVSDTGIGMTPEQLARIFDRFEQADSSTTRKHGGTGLGTSISLKLAELMGGSLEASSEPGRGSVFTLTLPAPPAELPRSRAASVTSRHYGRTVLLAEDNPVNTLIATRTLTDLGLQVVTATDGARAVELALSEAPDLILMDIQMPIVDGVEASRRIREAGSEVPILAMTASILATDLDRYRAAGMGGYIPKPFDREQLIRAFDALWPPSGPSEPRQKVSQTRRRDVFRKKRPA